MIKATTYEATTALVLEGRRRGKTYGRLVAEISYMEQDEIIAAYTKKKQARGRKRGRPVGKTCSDCKFWEWNPNSRAGGWCIADEHVEPKYTYGRDRACMKFIDCD